VKLLEIFRFEAGYQLRRAWPWLIAAVLIVFAFFGTRDAGLAEALYDEFFLNSDWPLASAVAICLLALLVGPIALFQRQQAKSLERQ